MVNRLTSTYKVILVFVLFQFVGINDTFAQNKDLIPGKWMVDEAELYAPKRDSMTMVHTMRIVKSFRYDFRKNGQLFYEDVDIKNATGTWSLEGDILTLKYTFEMPWAGNEKKEHNLTMKVLEMGESKMVWYQEFEPTETIKFYLKKQ